MYIPGDAFSIIWTAGVYLICLLSPSYSDVSNVRSFFIRFSLFQMPLIVAAVY